MQCWALNWALNFLHKCCFSLLNIILFELCKFLFNEYCKLTWVHFFQFKNRFVKPTQCGVYFSNYYTYQAGIGTLLRYAICGVYNKCTGRSLYLDSKKKSLIKQLRSFDKTLVCKVSMLVESLLPFSAWLFHGCKKRTYLI